MKSFSFGVIWFMVLGLIPLIQADDYIIDKETDATLLDCVIAFVVFCVFLLILTIILAVVVYRRSKGKRPPGHSNKGYNISYREKESPKDQSISSPFYGHGSYSYRAESSIYLPGRESTYINNDSTKIAVYENEGVVMEKGEKRDSPPQEKGQKDARMTEKTVTINTTYDNPAFENAGYESLAIEDDNDEDSHDYEIPDASYIAVRK